MIQFTGRVLTLPVFIKMNLSNIFTQLKNSFYKYTQGVVCIDSGVVGPTIGVLIMTHGNEPSGLYVYKSLVSQRNLLKKGKIIFILQNIKAGEGYFNNKQSTVDNRFYEINLNRIPKKFSKKDTQYEVLRARELQKIYRTCDFLIDIHSTSQKSDPMALVFTQKDLVFVKKSPSIKNIIIGLDRIQKGRPIMALAPSKTGKIAIECGPHITRNTHIRTLLIVKEIMSSMGILNIKNKKPLAQKTQQSIFKAVKSVVLKPGFQLVRKFGTFEKIRKGESIAISQGKTLHASADYYSIFCPKKYKSIPQGEEAFFLLKKI